MRLIVAILLLPILAVAQDGHPVSISNNRVSSYLKAYASVDGENPAPLDKVLYFLNRLSDKQQKFRNEQTFLRHVFLKTHQQLLKEYKVNSTFNDLLRLGNYNCLTATALYALILEHLGFDYEIIETNYHMFLLAKTSYGQVLLESTDPLQGFVINNQEIERKISAYRQNTWADSNKNKIAYQYKASLYNSIGLEGVHGLMYYNLAVDTYNRQDLVSSVSYLEQAGLRYRSQRLDEFSGILLLTVQESKIKTDLKGKLIRKIQSIRDRDLRMVASTKMF